MAFNNEKLKRLHRENQIAKIGEDIIPESKEFIKVQNWSMGKTIDIKIDDLKPFSQHKFDINQNKVEEYAESIKEQGLHIPIIVWDKSTSESGEYEILAGHHRVEACKLLGWEKIPAIIKKVDLPDAIDIVNYTNAMQRSFESLGLYEKCAVIKQMKDNKELQESRKPELKKEEIQVNKEKLSGVRGLGREFGVSKSLVSIYLTLYDKMTKSQIELMEDKEERKKIFDINTGILISKLPKKAIKEVVDYLLENEKSICKEQVKMLLDIWDKNGEFTEKDFTKVIYKYAENKKKNKPVSFKREDLRKYFDDDWTEEQIIQEIMQILEEERVSMGRKRNKFIPIRATEEEYEFIMRTLEKGKRIYGTYIGFLVAFFKNNSFSINQISNKEIIRLLTISSNNINQWTKGINTLNEVSIDDILKLKKEIEKMKKAVNEYGLVVYKSIKGEKK